MKREKNVMDTNDAKSADIITYIVTAPSLSI